MQEGGIIHERGSELPLMQNALVKRAKAGHRSLFYSLLPLFGSITRAL